MCATLGTHVLSFALDFCFLLGCLETMSVGRERRNGVLVYTCGLTSGLRAVLIVTSTHAQTFNFSFFLYPSTSLSHTQRNLQTVDMH